MKQFLPNQRFETGAPALGLADVGLDAPPMRFTAQAFASARAVSDSFSLSNLKEYSAEDLLKILESKRGAFPDNVDKERFVFWRALISNRTLDSYFTRMARSTLENFTEDLENIDVIFADSHKRGENGFGRSVVGQLINDGTPPAGYERDEFFPVVVGDFYSHLDLKFGSLSVEQFWLGLQTNVLQDVSVGFKEGEGFRLTCSVCNQNYWSWDCDHIAGLEYPANGESVEDPSESDEEPEMRVAFVWIENARLSEVSAVYDGATPFATLMSVKAEREIRARRLPEATEQFLQRRYNFERSENTNLFLEKRTSLSAVPATPKTKGENKMSENTTNAGAAGENRETIVAQNIKDFTGDIRALATAAGIEAAATAEPDALIRELKQRTRDASAKLEELARYRAAAIEEAEKQFVRAEGKGAEDRVEKTRSMLEKLELEEIGEMRDEWKKRGDARFESERITTAGDEADEADAEGEDATREVEGAKLDEVLPSNAARVARSFVQ